VRDVQVPPALLRLHLGEYIGGLHARQHWRRRLASAAMTEEVLRRSQDGSTPVTKEVGGLPGMNRRGLETTLGPPLHPHARINTDDGAGSCTNAQEPSDESSELMISPTKNKMPVSATASVFATK